MHFQWSSQAAWKTEWFDSEVISTKRPAATSLCLKVCSYELAHGLRISIQERWQLTPAKEKQECPNQVRSSWASSTSPKSRRASPWLNLVNTASSDMKVLPRVDTVTCEPSSLDIFALGKDRRQMCSERELHDHFGARHSIERPSGRHDHLPNLFCLFIARRHKSIMPLTVNLWMSCTSTKSQGLTSASNPKLITHLAKFSVQEVNFEHIF